MLHTTCHYTGTPSYNRPLHSQIFIQQAITVSYHHTTCHHTVMLHTTFHHTVTSSYNMDHSITLNIIYYVITLSHLHVYTTCHHSVTPSHSIKLYCCTFIQNSVTDTSLHNMSSHYHYLPTTGP